MIEAFPLEWPAGYERTTKKQPSTFKCTIAQARDGVLYEIRKLGGINPIISTNVPLKNNGQMYANERTVNGDNGVAVYFTWKGEQFVMACDRYGALFENLRAIEKSIEALRGLERWGASDILSRAFTGFKALPVRAGDSSASWWQILQVAQDAHPSVIKSSFRKLSILYHPDNQVTGDREKFDQLTSAWAHALKEN